MNRLSDSRFQQVTARRIADIEILRAFAILYVVFHHASGNLFKPGQFLGDFLQKDFGGWVGVDLFFAISGFVIARNLIPVLSSAAGPGQLRRETLRFWGKRAFRLLPSAWFWLFAILVLVVFFNDSGVFGDLKTNLWATLAGLLNFANVRFADAFLQYHYGVSFVYWSLSLEEQFYILLPILFFLTRRYLWVFLVLVVLLQLPQVRGLWGMTFRSDAICLGVLVAMFSELAVYSRLRFHDGPWHRFVATSLLLALLAAMPLIGALQQDAFPLQIGTLAILSALIVLLASYDNDLLARLPGGGLMSWIGARSYAIYLIHIPVFFSVRELAFRWDFKLGSFPVAEFIFTLTVIFLLAELNFRFIETPTRRMSHRIFSS